MPSGKKRKRHKMATHKRKKETEKEQTQKEVVIVCELEIINLRAMPLGLF